MKWWVGWTSEFDWVGSWRLLKLFFEMGWEGGGKDLGLGLGSAGSR